MRSGRASGSPEYDADGKAAEEIRSLWRWVWQSLTARSFDQEAAPIGVAGPADAGDAARQATN